MTDPRELPEPRQPHQPRRRRRLSLRARVLTSLVGLSALALTVAGATAYGIERDRLDRSLEDSLRRTVTEVEVLAAGEVDPLTGEPFSSAQQLLYAALQRYVPSSHEAAFSVADGAVVQYAELNRIRPDTDPELLAILKDAEHREDVVISRVETARADYRYVVVPVEVVGAPPAALVVAFERNAEHAALLGTFRVYALVAFAALAGIALAGWFIVDKIVEPIRLLRAATDEVTSSDLSARVPVEGKDDLADLTLTINAMLARLEGAFTAQRQLLDDVGHELRTPLTVVRGHLELMDPLDPSDTAATRALTLDELDRMEHLVTDLMTIARSERPDFISLAPVDVAVLLDEVLAKARTLGDRRWRLDSLAEGTVELDARRITQAMLQLASNAVRYSQPGSTVGLGSAWHAGGLRLWVRDEGVGIDPDEQVLVFDRFAKGRSATSESSGLGLAIVESIARAHGGSVSLTSAPGTGTTVELLLPIHQPHPPAQPVREDTE